MAAGYWADRTTDKSNPRTTAGAKGAGAVNSLNILVVDDDHDTRNVLRRLLTREGHAVATAETVAAALDLARAERVDLLISDIALPDGHGYDLMTAVKALHGVPGIALSGYVDDDDKRRAADAGFCVHLDKPVRFDDVLQAIEDCLDDNPLAA